MSKLPKIILLTLVLIFASAKLALAQAASPSPSPSGGTLPQSGVETPLLIIVGGGVTLLGSGVLLKKFQA